MKKVSAQKLQRHAGEVQYMALREPIAITHHGRERLVLLSMEEYTRLKNRERKSYAVEELPEWIVEAVAKAEMDPKFDELNRLLD